MRVHRFSAFLRIGAIALLAAVSAGPSLVRADDTPSLPPVPNNKTVEIEFRDIHETFWTFPPRRKALYRVADILTEGMAPHLVQLSLVYLSGLEDAPPEVQKRWATQSPYLAVDKEKPESREGLLQLLQRKQPIKLSISALKRSSSYDPDPVEQVTADFLGRKGIPLTTLVRSENEVIQKKRDLAAIRAEQQNAAPSKSQPEQPPALEFATASVASPVLEEAPKAEQISEPAPFFNIVIVKAPPRKPPRIRGTLPGSLSDIFIDGVFLNRRPSRDKEEKNFIVMTVPNIVVPTNTALAAVNKDSRKLFDAMDAELLNRGTNALPAEIGTAAIAK
jgi:hypothetical protein